MQRTKMIVAAGLAALIAGASVAVAAQLITGKDIKNGSIAQKDLKKKVRNKLNRSGEQGPQGQGPSDHRDLPVRARWRPTRTPSGRRLTATRSGRRSRHFAPVRTPVRCSLRSASAPWA